jgi:hypothetical protein
LARLSLRISPVFIAATLLLAPVAKASPGPPIPRLIETNPGSPSIALKPLVIGNSAGGGAIPNSVRPSLGAIRLTSGTEENTIALYLDDKCQGTVVGGGSANELDTDGIQAEVQPQRVSFIYATQSNPEGDTSDCSEPLKYEHVKELPAPPKEPPAGEGPGGAPSIPGSSTGSASVNLEAPHLRIAPGGRANDNTPALSGSAPGADAVKLFSNPSCNGTPIVRIGPGQFAAGLQVQVSDNTTTSFSVASTAGAAQSPCSAEVTYVEDSTAPRTRITMGPGVKTRKHKAVFRFADITEDSPGTDFFCRINHSKWKQCNSPFKVRHLRTKHYVVRVKAIDSAGNAEAKGAKRRFKVIRSS